MRDITTALLMLMGPTLIVTTLVVTLALIGAFR